MRNRGVSAGAARYLMDRPGEAVWLQDIADYVGTQERPVQSAINNMRNTPGDQVGEALDVLVRGQCWRYMPDNSPEAGTDNTLFEEVGRTKQGHLVLQDCEGNLYRAQALE